jgi:hypothetical protein
VIFFLPPAARGKAHGAWRFAHSEYLDPPQKLLIIVFVLFEMQLAIEIPNVFL